MSYRTLKIAGKTYHYTIGKSFSKIRGIGVFKNEVIGDKIDNTEKYIVSPYNIANVIRGEYTPRTIYQCIHGLQTHKLVSDIVEQERIDMVDCPHCKDEKIPYIKKVSLSENGLTVQKLYDLLGEKLKNHELPPDMPIAIGQVYFGGSWADCEVTNIQIGKSDNTLKKAHNEQVAYLMEGKILK